MYTRTAKFWYTIPHRDESGAVAEMDYFEMPEMPGKKFFKCDKKRATLSVESCAGLWREGHAKGAHERFWGCRGCSIGAGHANASEATLCDFYNKQICGRCCRGATRLIGVHLCPSCANRGYEWVKGRNARGNKPVTHPDLHTLGVRYQTGGRIKVLRKQLVVSTQELVIAALRDEPKQVTFCMALRRSPLPQGELFV